MVVNQVQKEYSCTSTKMLAYCQEVRKLEGTFDGLELTHVLRNNNNEADELAKMGSKRTPIPIGVFLFNSSISRPSAKSQQNQPTSHLPKRSL